VAVVVDFDAARRARQVESLGKLSEELLLRARLGEFPPERFARISECMLDQILLLAALRLRDFDLVAGFCAERFGKQRAILDVVRDQDQPRRRPLVIELAEKRGENFFRSDRAIGFGKIGAVAPVLSGAEEEDLDAGKSALLMHGKNVGLFDAARIDALMRLDRR